ncbi:TPA: LysR family transcriptional regulator, partial [Mannheimia haemolytica]|nr:LysR family transcriptional regulator [Mannheimia haemolytica]
MDKLNAISLFCKVIETQSFTQAAQQAQISLPMASKLVAQLE